MNRYVQNIDVFNMALVEDDPSKLEALESYSIGQFYAYVSARHTRATRKERTR